MKKTIYITMRFELDVTNDDDADVEKFVVSLTDLDPETVTDTLERAALQSVTFQTDEVLP